MTKETQDRKKPYEPPQIHRVELTPEEMFVGGCKTAVSESPSATPCDLNSCFNLGS